MKVEELIIALSALPSLSAKGIFKILQHNGLTSSKENIYGKIKYPSDLSEKAKTDASSALGNDNKISKECRKNNIDPIFFDSKNYPSQLREIPDFPPVIYARGNTDLLREKLAIGVVGSRRPSPYGLSKTSKIIGELANYFVVVSGLAMGIDSAAHLACLKAGGKTIAVLGTPIDKIYPSSNEQLADRIIKSDGLIISEYPPGFMVGKYSFPLRNRIIAGLSMAVLVMEAAKESGSLITASLALDYNREVFALPGNVDSGLSKGTNQLIKNGASILLESSDVLCALNVLRQKRLVDRVEELNFSQKKIIDLLRDSPLQFDKIQNLTKIDVATLNCQLIDLEMKKIISRRVDGSYCLLTD